MRSRQRQLLAAFSSRSITAPADDTRVAGSATGGYSLSIGMGWPPVQVRATSRAAHGNLFNSVAATTSSSAWAVGYYNSGDAIETLTARVMEMPDQWAAAMQGSWAHPPVMARSRVRESRRRVSTVTHSRRYRRQGAVSGTER